MLSLLEPSVPFLASLEPHFHDLGSTRHVSTASLHQVETFLCIFSTLLNDYFAHGQKKLKSLEGSHVAKPAVASAVDVCSHSVEQTRCSAESLEHIDGKSLKIVENFSYASDDCNALKHLLALAYIWGFGSSLLNRYFIVFTCFNVIERSCIGCFFKLCFSVSTRVQLAN